MRRVGRIYQLPRRAPDRDGKNLELVLPLSNVGDMCMKKGRLSAQELHLQQAHRVLREPGDAMCDML